MPKETKNVLNINKLCQQFCLFVDHSQNVSILCDHSRHSRNKGGNLAVILIQLSILQILSIDLVSCLLCSLVSRLLTILTFTLQVAFVNWRSFPLHVFVTIIYSLITFQWKQLIQRSLQSVLTVVILSLHVLLYLCF